MIERLGMPNFVAPRGQDVIYHYVITLLKKQEIVTTNVWKREDQLFSLHLNWTRIATFCCRDQDNVKQRLISGIIEQMGLHGQVRFRNEVVCLEYRNKETS